MILNEQFLVTRYYVFPSYMSRTFHGSHEPTHHYKAENIWAIDELNDRKFSPKMQSHNR